MSHIQIHQIWAQPYCLLPEKLNLDCIHASIFPRMPEHNIHDRVLEFVYQALFGEDVEAEEMRWGHAPADVVGVDLAVEAGECFDFFVFEDDLSLSLLPRRDLSGLV